MRVNFIFVCVVRCDDEAISEVDEEEVKRTEG